MPAPFVRLGRVIKTHGVEGEVSLALREDLSSGTLGGLDVWVVPPIARGAVPWRIATSRPGPKGTLVRLETLDSPEATHELVGRWLLARAADVPDAPTGAPDLSGYEVIDERRGPIGTVTETIVTGANDVLVVEGGPFGQVLVPVLDDVIGEVDEGAGVLRVELLPGLITEDEQ
jgi:16S rRNA processing protein RimM